MKKCNEYIQLSAVSHTWDELFENWKNGFVSVEKKKDKIVIRYVETPHLFWLRKSKSKLQIYEYIQEAELAHVVKACPTYFSNELTDFNELLAWGTLKSYLHTDDIYTLIDDIPIIYWIKAYAALIRYAKKVNFINSCRRLFRIRALLGKWLLVRSKNEWIYLFTQARANTHKRKIRAVQAQAPQKRNRLYHNDKRPPLRRQIHTMPKRKTNLQKCLCQNKRRVRAKALRANKNDENRNRQAQKEKRIKIDG
ncbi:MAG: hypothetical protein J6A53_05690 [Clostridia bacterium]|nr:hypothetical protein [Clostridia bacterium]